MKSTYHMIAACLLISLVYFAAQVEFLQYYQAYKEPFGRVDVDNYLGSIYDRADKTQESKGKHLLIYTIGKIARMFNAVELLFTFLIPFVSCVLMTGTVFLFILYFTRDSEISLLGLIFYIFGTYSMQAFMISAYWAQLFATIGMLLFIVFYEEFMLKKNRACLILCLVCAMYMAFAHLKFVGAIPLYIMARVFVKKDYTIAVGLLISLLIGWALFPTILLSTYPIPMGLDYVFSKFLFPAFWFLVLAYIIFWRKELSDIDRTFFVFTMMVFLISSFSALWRPLISVLPFLIYFVVKFFKEMRDGAVKTKQRGVYYAVVTVTIAFLFIYFYYITSYALSSMLGEMIPGVFPFTYRDMDPNPLLRMLGGSASDLSKFNYTQNTTVHRVVGFVSDLTGKTTETDVIINGS